MKNQKENIGVIVTFIIVACVIGFVVYILMNNNKEINSKLLSENKTPENKSEVLPSEDITKKENNLDQEPNTTNKEQTPPINILDTIAKKGDTLVMNYTGRLTNGTVFDSNVDPKFGHVQTFEFTLGAGQVIQGWDEGLLGMKIGDKKTLTIPPEKGYGARATGSIPANSTLIFDVELVGIK
jgi:peptidylprolyl isomerase/FKBP-type peptidyl-prolyl cis-trans isomerase FkpA